MSESQAVLSVEKIESSILLLRGQKVMLDRDLAVLYGVTTGNLNKAVQRNIERFPSDFMLQLAPQEVANLMFQTGISSQQHGGRRKPVHAFTEQGVAMLSGVLKSARAVELNIAIMRAFVKLREVLALHKELAHKLADLEKKVEGQDANIQNLFEAIRQLMAPPETPRKEIGFHIKEGSAPYRVNKKTAKKS